MIIFFDLSSYSCISLIYTSPKKTIAVQFEALIFLFLQTSRKSTIETICLVLSNHRLLLLPSDQPSRELLSPHSLTVILLSNHRHVFLQCDVLYSPFFICEPLSTLNFSQPWLPTNCTFEFIFHQCTILVLYAQLKMDE